MENYLKVRLQYTFNVPWLIYFVFVCMLTDILVCGDKKDSNNKVRYTNGTEPLDEAY